jgi:flagellar hook-length control protein FliK
MLESIQLMRQAGGALSSDAAMPASFAALLASLPTDPAAATAPAAAAPPVPLTNPWPIDDPAFASHLAAQVGESLVGGLERAEISVTPPEMGPIRIELSLAGDQASVTFAAAMPETRNAIEQSLPMLRSMLSEQGLVLADATVGRGDADAGDTREWTSSDGGGDRRDQGAGHGRSPGADDRSGGGAIAATPLGRRTARGLLDLFA